MRHLIFPLVFAGMSTSALANADTPTSSNVDRFELPSQTEIEDMIDRLPDFNAIIDDVIKLTENDRLQERMERSGEAFSDKLESSGALEPDENGVPDIKLALKVMMSALSDEEVTGGMLETLAELQTLMDKHLPETRDVEKVE